MKTVEQIQDMVNYNQDMIDEYKKFQEAARNDITAKLVNESNSPEHVAKWMPSWMNDINYYTSKIAEIEEQNKILKWVLKG